MITKKQLKIFEPFAKRPFAEHTRNGIKTESKVRSNNALALTINSLKKEDILIEKKIGKSGLLTLNLNNELTYYYLALCNINRINHLVKLSLETLKKEITEQTPFYSIAVFGSYASGDQKEGSDIDIAVFIENKTDQKRVEALANSAKMKSALDLDVHVITINEMIEMLVDPEENLGKQIARKHVAVYNHRIFYEIIKQGVKHGFRI